MAIPVVSSQKPAPGDIKIVKNSPIIFSVTDTAVGVDPNSVKIWINGNLIYSFQKLRQDGWLVDAGVIADGFEFTVTPSRRFRYYRNDETITIRLVAADTLTNELDTNWAFSTVRNISMRTYFMIIRGMRKLDEEQ